jgi:type I restriction enzyme S subunit
MIFYKETDFQETLIGKIPSDWSISKLGGLVKVETGKRAKGGGLAEGNVASIGGEHIDNEGRIIWREMKFIPDDFYDSLKEGKVKLGDILLVKDGATTGKVAFVRELKYEKVAVNEHVFVIRSKTEHLANDFLFYFLLSKYGQNQIKKRFHGIIGGIIRDDLETIFLPIPPPEEQRVIAGVLGVVDSVIAKTDEIIAKTERLKKGLMQTLLTRGIGHKEFEETQIGKIPKTWEIAKLSELCEHITKGTTPTTYGFKFIDSGVNFIKVESIDEHGFFIPENIPHISEEANKAFSRSILKENDILFSIAGALGRVAIITKEILPANTNQALAIIRLKNQDKVLGEYLKYFLMGPQIQNFVKTIAIQSQQANINLEHVRNFFVALPSLGEQKRIFEILNTVDNKLILERKEKERLKRIKQALMDLLLTGKIRVKVDCNNHR